MMCGKGLMAMHSWMGVIKEGDEYLTCRKYQRRTEATYMQCEGEKALYYLLAGDVRIIFTQHKEIIPVSRPRRGGANSKNPVIYQLNCNELEVLKNRVYIPQ